MADLIRRGCSIDRFVQAVWRRLTSLGGRPWCESCRKPVRRLVPGDLPPEEVRSRRMSGTLGGLLAAGYVCDACTKPGAWVLVE